VFKPFWFEADYKERFAEESSDRLTKYWKDQEIFRRKVLSGMTAGLAEYLKKRNELEDELIAMEQEAVSADEKERVTEYAFAMEKKLVEEVLIKPEGRYNGISLRDVYYRWYWNRQNKALK